MISISKLSPQPPTQRNNDAMPSNDTATNYAYYFESIAPDNLDKLAEMLADDVVFIDPFNRLTGRHMMVSVFTDMFKTMTDPKFKVLDVAYSQTACYMKWRMTGIVKSAPNMPFDITGMSEVHFNDDGKVVLHHDHWDSASQLLSFLPYIGWITRRIMRLFAHG